MNITVEHAPNDTLAFAAGELRSYLGRMLPAEHACAVRLEVVPAPGNDSFSVDLSPAGGTITGSSPRAVLLGVYDALRRLGCRFLAPGRGGELVPSIAPGAVDLHYEKVAAYSHRGVCIEGADSRENILDFIDWLPKLGFNAFFLQFKTPYAFLARWYEHQNNPTREPEPLEPAFVRSVTDEAEAALARRGLLLHKVGHGWTGAVLGYDTDSWDGSAQPLPEDKRPLAAQVDGVRGLFGGVPANTNLCLSDPMARERFALLVTDYARANTGVDYLHVWLADCFNNVCECPACRESTVSDQYVELLNDIDRRLTGEGLDTKLVFLLYQELLWPPIRARLEHPDRFVLMFAPISRTFARSYDAAGVPPILPYVRNRITLPGDLGENLAFLRGWQEIFSGDSFVYDYPLGRAHYGDLGYIHIARVIFEDAHKLGALGLNGYISCQELRAGSPNFLPNYVMGRALLDPEADFDAIVEEYFAAAYGEGADTARDCLGKLSRMQLCDYINGKGPRVDEHAAEKAREAGRLCAELAAAAARYEGPFWRALGHHARYAGMLSGALELLAQGRDGEAHAAWEAMAGYIRASEREYQPWLDVYRVLDVTGNYTGL